MGSASRILNQWFVMHTESGVMTNYTFQCSHDEYTIWDVDSALGFLCLFIFSSMK